MPRQARHNLALALAALGQQDRMLRVLRLDMGQAEAVAMGQELVAVAAQISPGTGYRNPRSSVRPWPRRDGPGDSVETGS
ncbi:hypothetical protein ACFQY5_03800 [Paeniroseomonas aquatica]|uniref:hypothetical protein n=1 Tax=Paeniroseomonas aquatica TaxID=373043 RepID=UPI003622E204